MGLGKLPSWYVAIKAHMQFTLPSALRSTVAPSGTSLLACNPLVSTPADVASIAALLLTPRGVILSGMSLTKAGEASEDRWEAVSGPVVELGDLDVDGLVLSPAATRGGLGFVCVHGKDGIKLVLAPTESGELQHTSRRVQLTGSRRSGQRGIQALSGHVVASCFGHRPRYQIRRQLRGRRARRVRTGRRRSSPQ